MKQALCSILVFLFALLLIFISITGFIFYPIVSGHYDKPKLSRSQYDCDTAVIVYENDPAVPLCGEIHMVCNDITEQICWGRNIAPKKIKELITQYESVHNSKKGERND